MAESLVILYERYAEMAASLRPFCEACSQPKAKATGEVRTSSRMFPMRTDTCDDHRGLVEESLLRIAENSERIYAESRPGVWARAVDWLLRWLEDIGRLFGLIDDTDGDDCYRCVRGRCHIHGTGYYPWPEIDDREGE